MTLSRIAPEAARLARRPVLEAAVAAGARCVDRAQYRDLLDRNRSAPPAIWAAQQAAAQKLCAACPVRPSCEELALRYGGGDRNSDDQVRGGRRGQDLAIDREIRQAGRIATAVTADWQQPLGLAATPRGAAGADVTDDVVVARDDNTMPVAA